MQECDCRIVDVGTEWRSFSGEKSGIDPSRVGAPENPLLGSSDLSTSIAIYYGSSESDQRFTVSSIWFFSECGAECLMHIEVKYSVSS